MHITKKAIVHRSEPKLSYTKDFDYSASLDSSVALAPQRHENRQLPGHDIRQIVPSQGTVSNCNDKGHGKYPDSIVNK